MDLEDIQKSMKNRMIEKIWEEIMSDPSHPYNYFCTNCKYMAVCFKDGEFPSPCQIFKRIEEEKEVNDE